MRPVMLAVLGLVGCGDTLDLETDEPTCDPCGQVAVTPATLDFGDIDFQDDVDGEALTVTVENTGDIPLGLDLVGIEGERMRVEGGLGELDVGESVSITVTVFGYVPGELGSEVTGELLVESGMLPASVPIAWSYTPRRGSGDDTGF